MVRSIARQPSVAAQRLGYDPLYLSVDRAEFLRRSALDQLHSVRVEPE